MRSIGPNEIKFKLQIIQMMRFTFIHIKYQSSPIDGSVTQTVFTVVCFIKIFRAFFKIEKIYKYIYTRIAHLIRLDKKIDMY